jgi:hypothetical protein
MIVFWRNINLPWVKVEIELGAWGERRRTEERGLRQRSDIRGQGSVGRRGIPVACGQRSEEEKTVVRDRFELRCREAAQPMTTEGQFDR